MDLMELMESAPMQAQKSFEPMPEGTYKAKVTDATVKQGSDELKYNIEFTITEGEFTNRKLWFSPKVTSKSSPAYPGVIKGKIYQMAGMKESNGKSLPEILQVINGSLVDVSLSYRPNTTNPDKPWQDVTAKPSDESIPF